MWTANLKSVSRRDDQIRLIVVFNDGVDEVEKEYSLSSKQGIKQLIQNEINRIQELTSFANALTPGLIDLTPDVPSVPTQATLERITYTNDLNTFRHMKNGVELGIFTGLEPQVTNLQVKLINGFKTAYIDLL